MLAAGSSSQTGHTAQDPARPSSSLPGLVILPPQEDVLSDATRKDPGLLRDVGQASVDPHRALQQVHLEQTESSLRTGGQRHTLPTQQPVPQAPLPPPWGLSCASRTLNMVLPGSPVSPREWPCVREAKTDQFPRGLKPSSALKPPTLFALVSKPCSLASRAWRPLTVRWKAPDRL